MTANFSIYRESLLVLVLATAVYCLNAQADTVSEARGRAREIATANGYIERGADIHPSQLDFVPAAMQSACAYNAGVTAGAGGRKRWLWC